MADTVQVNLSRALKIKNRVVHRLAQLDGQVVAHNSAPQENQEYDVRATYRARMVLSAGLVRLKTAISAANLPIQHLIFELAECKSLAAMLGRVNTQHGMSVEGYSGTRVMHVAQFRKQDIDREVRRVEREIDRIQDELDGFNHRTLVAIDAALVAEEEESPGLAESPD